MKLYEGMFLFDNQAAHEWSAVDAEVRRLCSRIGAELLVCVKFDERRLAYEIKGRKRGTYVLTYFNSDPTRITDLERDAHLTDAILRILVLRAENVTEERVKELQARSPEEPLQVASERRPDDGPGRGRRDDSDDRPMRSGPRRGRDDDSDSSNDISDD